MDVQRAANDCMVTTAELAARVDFRLGNVLVSPPTRRVTGPSHSVDVEPRVMQVLVVLADAAGQVVTRETLFNRCWGSVYVGDDSLNRAVAAVRRAVAQVGGQGFEIETVPRTGYRLVGSVPTPFVPPPDSSEQSNLVTRRRFAGGALAVAALGAYGAWSFQSARSNREFKALIGSAEKAIREQTTDAKTARDLQRAISLRNDDAKGWALLAYLKSIETVSANPSTSEPALKEARDAAAKALAIDARAPYALLAMFELQGSTLDWATRDRRLRRIIAIDPLNVPAIGELVLLTQAAGLNRESWNWNERAITLNPFSFDGLSKRALKLWIAGRVAQADKVIDQVLALYPRHPWPWWVRFLIYALSDRPRAAQAMLDASPQKLGSAEEISLWRMALVALERHSAAATATLREACINAAEGAGVFAGTSVMMLSALGEVDAAFDIANGFLLSRGKIVRSRSLLQSDINDATWRINTQWLFTPPCAVMRADPRFLPLCDGMGLVDYWRARGVRPDYQLKEG